MVLFKTLSITRRSRSFPKHFIFIRTELFCQVDLAMDVFKRIHPDEEIPEGSLQSFAT